VVNNAVEPCGAARACRHNAVVKALGKDPLAAERLVTTEPTRSKVEASAAACTS